MECSGTFTDLKIIEQRSLDQRALFDADRADSLLSVGENVFHQLFLL